MNLNKLFILGNGFDLAHELPTKYDDFRKYLLKSYPKLKDRTVEHDYEHVNAEDTVAFIIGLISSVEVEKEWKFVEDSLGRLPFEEYLERWAFAYEGEENVDCDDVKYELEFSSDNYYLGMLEFNKLFTDWVNSIDESDIVLKQEFKKLINEERDFFINFNYTHVLEDIYNAKNVCHIHGKKYGSELLFGHGEDLRESVENLEDAFEKNLAKINNLLRKNTNDAYEKNKDFFAELSSVTEIYSHGFSFSKIDLFYILRICEVCNTEKCKWYLSDYESDHEREEYKGKIIDCGFKGEFKLFSIVESVKQ